MVLNPDERLLGNLASKGTLSQSKILNSEIERLLKDDRSKAFIKRFADAWLRLDKIGSMPPGTKQFPTYFRSIRGCHENETYYFVVICSKRIIQFRSLLMPYIFNGALARHYGVNGVAGENFRKVQFPQKFVGADYWDTPVC